ncbi:hypothetical protein GHN41_21070 [Pseudomonas helleri]|uniref:Uncharacterized protein n=1 Tax=Pseudomonas helleri TaxID=1608996 RepID=A0A6G1W955_9PSED|nr:MULTISPECIES: hypothetical protein [Pseudomonas]MQT27531.1 hypothetical protein [Pseudomonas helleri]MQU18919.1 hypothetical protein [Pseudomonas helleri]PAA33113.1 hypothetical protein CJU79_23075 [Pseudomonas fragi]
MTVEAEIKALVDSPVTSYWLRNALLSVLTRDYIDAVKDADVLSDLLNRRATEKLGLDAEVIYK